MIAPDKALHAIAGTIVYAAAHIAVGQWAIVAVGVAGVSKEVYDHFTGGDVDAMDIVATIAGGFIGAACAVVA